MKKSQLRNIIKESIREVLNEQNFPTGPNWQTLSQMFAGGNIPQPPQPFIDRMNNMGCAGKQSRYQHLINRISSLVQGINPNTGAQQPGADPMYGSNPLWQGQLAAKIFWLQDDLTNNCGGYSI